MHLSPNHQPRVWALTLAFMAASSAQAAPNVSLQQAEVFNLLAPFLALNDPGAGQATLGSQALATTPGNNLSATIAVNNAAATSATIAGVAISDKAIFSANSGAFSPTTITLPNGTVQTLGVAANLAGGLPQQKVQGATGTVTPYQPYGGLGQLGAAYQALVSPPGGNASATVTLLTNAYNNLTSPGVSAKNYFANGTINGTAPAVPPSGITLPTHNGLPNTSNSVFDIAYGVKNTDPGQGTFGNSRPVQVAPTLINAFDPTAITGLATNPAFPSGHTNYAYTDSLLIGMLSPQNYQSMLLRASEYGNSRIALGVHYPLDIIASRSFSAELIAQALSNATNYTQFNLPSQFNAAASELTPILTAAATAAGCGTLQACANSNPYNSFSLATYGNSTGTPTAPTAPTSNAEIYAARLSYGLPTLSYSSAPREQAPAGYANPAVLLATLYGGSSTIGTTGIYGSLSQDTINQIIVNTEGKALAAFYGSALSFWSRINLYDAAGYLQHVIGTLNLAAGDKITTDVTVANGGALRGPGTIGTAAAANSLTVLAGGLVSPGLAGETAGNRMVVNGGFNLDPNAVLQFLLAGSGAGEYDTLQVNGLATLGGLLDFRFVNGFTLSGPSSFDLLDFTSLVGDFSGLLFGGNACATIGLHSWSCASNVLATELISGTSISLLLTVPEPGAMALFSLALAGLAWSRRHFA